jgi:hypothetical protein
LAPCVRNVRGWKESLHVPNPEDMYTVEIKPRILMKRKNALFIFLGICIILAIMILLKAMSSLVGGIFFAMTILVLGLLSQAFRK